MRIPRYEVIDKNKVVLSLKDFENLLEALAFDEAKAQASADTDRGRAPVPAEVVKRLLSGESPVRVWRNHRGLTQAALAKRAKLTQATIAEIETGRKKGSIATLKALAKALNVDLDDIA